MPFTFSHPAIVLPFLKSRSRYVCMSALVIGSMIPDFEYFIKMKLSGRFSHTVPGIFFFDLPVGVLVMILFHGFIKKPLISNLPVYFSTRLQPLLYFDFFKYFRKHWFASVMCLLAGIVSHIFWDGFTHNKGSFTTYLPILLKPFEITGLPDLPVYRLLQHASTFVGALTIIFIFGRQQQYPIPAHKIDLRFWTILTFFFTITFLIRASLGLGYYGDTVAVIIGSGFVGLIAASLLPLRNI